MKDHLNSVMDVLRQKKVRSDYRYFNIRKENLVAELGIEYLLDKLGVEYIDNVVNGYIWGFCPDHFQNVNRYPSHPKWSVNILTGDTYCFTESRCSNIIEICQVLKNCTKNEAFKFFLGDKEEKINVAIRKNIPKNKIVDYDPTKNENLNSVRNLIELGFYNDMVIDFFKKDGITEKTIKDFGICYVETGSLKNRALIPFYDSVDVNTLIGYAAVSLENKKEYIRNKVRDCIRFFGLKELSEIKKAYKECYKRYKKTLFCSGAPISNHLFGLSRLIKQHGVLNYVVLVEGERDVIKLQQEGINAIGIHGTSLNSKQIELIQHYGIEKIVICLDADDAGIEGAEKIYKNIQGKFKKVENLILPKDKKDPKLYNGKDFNELLQPKLSGDAIANLQKRIRIKNARERQTKNQYREKTNIMSRIRESIEKRHS